MTKDTEDGEPAILKEQTPFKSIEILHETAETKIAPASQAAKVKLFSWPISDSGTPTLRITDQSAARPDSKRKFPKVVLSQASLKVPMAGNMRLCACGREPSRAEPSVQLF